MAAEIKDAKVEMAAGFNKVDKRFERLEAREKERERHSSWKRANQAAIDALEKDEARLKALASKEGPAATPGIERGAQAIQDDIDRLQGGHQGGRQ
ncbi:MAG: hypothetical protein LQ340_002270 [Diploschistes diacapsis]|nr:MAG: hypothetical protein LQ340_002270 [Diploschistes diacapsis]